MPTANPWPPPAAFMAKVEAQQQKAAAAPAKTGPPPPPAGFMAKVKEREAATAPPPAPPPAADAGELLGLWVKVSGLKGRPELNGKCGTVVDFDAAKGRYVVELDGESVSLKGANLAPTNEGAPPPPPPPGGGNGGLPHPWQAVDAPGGGGTYYYNPVSGVTSWERPR